MKQNVTRTINGLNRSYRSYWTGNDRKNRSDCVLTFMKRPRRSGSFIQLHSNAGVSSLRRPRFTIIDVGEQLTPAALFSVSPFTHRIALLRLPASSIQHRITTRWLTIGKLDPKKRVNEDDPRRWTLTFVEPPRIHETEPCLLTALIDSVTRK